MNLSAITTANIPWQSAVQRLLDRWNRLTLAAQFLAVAAVVLTVGMLLVGNWVVNRISQTVIHTHAVEASLYTDSIIEPLVQELAAGDRLSAGVRAALDRLAARENQSQRILGFRVWKGDTIVYSDKPELIGRKFEPTEARQHALRGQVSAELIVGSTEEHPTLIDGAHVLEVYAPVRKTGTGEIIGLTETYYTATALPDDLALARKASWFFVAIATVSMLLAQSIVVLKGSRTIEDQRVALDRRVSELQKLLAENEQLRARAGEANRRVTEMNERYLRQIGADLHDGPVQMLSIAVLRLNSLSETISECEPAIVDEARIDIVAMRDALRESLEEIRSLSAGLAAPEIDKLSLRDVLNVVAQRHERRTGSAVACTIGDLPAQFPASVKYCIYRFAQEGLHNGYRHGGSRGQQLVASADDHGLRIEVLDRGPGLPDEAMQQGTGQGLIGLRDRIQSLGGRFTATRRPEGGTRLVAEFIFMEAREAAISHV